VESDLCVPKRTTKRRKAPRFSGKRSPSREGVGTEILASPQAKHRVLSKGATGRGAAEDTPSLSRQRVGDGRCTAGTRGGELTQCVGPSLGPVGLGGFLRPASLVARGLRPLQRSPCSLRVARLSGDDHVANTGETEPRKRIALPMWAGVTALVGRARTSNLYAEVGRRRRSNETAPQRQEGETADGDLAHGRQSSRGSKRRCMRVPALSPEEASWRQQAPRGMSWVKRSR